MARAGGIAAPGARLLAVAAAGIGTWAGWRMHRADAPRLARAWGVLVALALLGVVWIGVMGQLMSLHLND